MDASLQDLNQKIDGLTAQVAYLSEQAQLAERQRQERAELVRDVTPLANQAFELAVEQLEEIQEYVDLSDLLRLVKRLLRNERNLEKMLDQLESLSGLVETVGPLANDVFSKMVDVMADLEAKGYFAIARSGGKLADNLVSNFTAEDLDRVSVNIKPFMDMVKMVTEPNVIQTANHTLVEARQVLEETVDGSYGSLLRLIRDPAVRRGLVLTLRILQVIGNQAASRLEMVN